MYETIRIEDHDGVVLLVFNRPDKLNAINEQMYREMDSFFNSLASGEGSAQVLVLTGEGRAFIAGADIGPYQTMTLAEFRAFQRLGRRVMEKMERLACPVIAAVERLCLRRRLRNRAGIGHHHRRGERQIRLTGSQAGFAAGWRRHTAPDAGASVLMLPGA